MTSQKPSLSVQISASEAVRQWLRRNGKDLPATLSPRTAVVAAAMQVVFEHHGAILLLVRNGMYASSLALLRPIYEGCILAMWLFRIASDKDLLELAKNRLSPGLEKMIRDLDREHFLDAPMLTTLKPLIRRMDGFVHGGFEHFRYRIQKDGVIVNYPEDLVVDALQFADLFAIMTLLEWPALAGDEEMGARLYVETKALLGFRTKGGGGN